MEAGISVPEQLQSRCCIVGGGPAGMMLGYLLARAGIDVLVLEKHADFLATSAATLFIPRLLKQCMSWVCSKTF